MAQADMVEEQQFCLRWNNFQTHLTTQFESLREKEDFVDVTLACHNHHLKAHKVVLSACSPYFRQLFKSCPPYQHPIVIMRDVEFCHMRSLLEFVYAGEVRVAQAELAEFLRTAEMLQIRGLAGTPDRPQVATQEPSPLSAHSRSSPAAQVQSSDGEGNNTGEEEITLDTQPPPAKRSRPPPAPCEPLDIKRSPESEASGRHGSSDGMDNDNVPELIQPKLEIPDYSSDGEVARPEYLSGNMTSSALAGLENSVEMQFGFGLERKQHSGLDFVAGTSGTDCLQDTSQGCILPPLKKKIKYSDVYTDSDTSDDTALERNGKLEKGSFVLVEYPEYSNVHYIGKITEMNADDEQPIKIDFMRKVKSKQGSLTFIWTDIEDEEYMSSTCVKKKIRKPSPLRGGRFLFDDPELYNFNIKWAISVTSANRVKSGL